MRSRHLGFVSVFVRTSLVRPLRGIIITLYRERGECVGNPGLWLVVQGITR